MGCVSPGAGVRPPGRLGSRAATPTHWLIEEDDHPFCGRPSPPDAIHKYLSKVIHRMAHPCSQTHYGSSLLVCKSRLNPHLRAVKVTPLGINIPDRLRYFSSLMKYPPESSISPPFVWNKFTAGLICTTSKSEKHGTPATNTQLDTVYYSPSLSYVISRGRSFSRGCGNMCSLCAFFRLEWETWNATSWRGECFGDSRGR